jgi:hypothetical protein
MTATPETDKPYAATLYRGLGQDAREAARTRVPAQFAEEEHWSTREEIARTYGPMVQSREISLHMLIAVQKRATFAAWDGAGSSCRAR